jgi:mRNA interferase RelE/StbE
MNCSANRLLKNDPSAGLPSSLIIAAYIRVRLILRDCLPNRQVKGLQEPCIWAFLSSLRRNRFFSNPLMGERRTMYKLVVPKDVKELIRTMHPTLKKKVKASLTMILANPHSGKALLDELSGLRSFRVSSFRIIYRVKDPGQIELLAIGPRERIYEATFRILQKKIE